MFGFEVFPPEINSGLMYTGPGAGPMAAAAAAWDALADMMYLSAAAYSLAIADLAATWLGPSSRLMAAAAARYVEWMSRTADQALETGAQAKAAMAAYEAAFAMTVPPAEIAANRALLLALIATNFFGQNTPAIMATEAQYFEMWAQDAAAMYGYAGASSVASTVTPFTPAPDTTSSSGGAGIAAAVTQAAATPVGATVQAVAPLTTTAAPSAALQAAATTATSSSTVTTPLSALTVSTASTSSTTTMAAATSLASGSTSTASMLTSAVSTVGSSGSLSNTLGSAAGAVGGGFPMFKTSLDIGVTPGAGAWSSPNNVVSAVTGRAASLGALSVPQGWTSAAPAFSHVASALPAGGEVRPSLPVGSPNRTGPLGVPKANSTDRGRANSPVPAHYRFRPAVVQRPVYTG